MKSILVTGPAGFIGSAFVKTFSERYPKTEIVGIDDFSTGKRESISKNITFYEGSITDQKLLRKIFSKHHPEYVFHFAALPRVAYSLKHPTDTTLVNIAGTVNLLEHSKDFGVKRFINSSSSAAYGEINKDKFKESFENLKPVSPYGLQKYTSEKFCKLFSDLFKLDTVSLRYFNVFGPGSLGDSPHATVISAWLTALYFPKLKNSFIEGDGKQSKEYTYLDNAVEACILAMNATKPLNGDVFNIAHGEKRNLWAIKKLIEKYTNKKLILEARPARAGDVRKSLADISKAKQKLGYKVLVNFEDGLKKTVEWYESLN
ncbi:MAG: NAD-dependent epimerase/dehydratase family protein [Patescibacteria group bacterium]